MNSPDCHQVTVSLDDITRHTRCALIVHGALPWIADEVASAVRKAEATGNIICGLLYLESYCQQLVTGRVNGKAEPEVSQPKPATVFVDAKYGFAQSAFARGIDLAISTAKAFGTCSLAIAHSHTCTSVGYFTEQIACAGLIGIGTTNASAVVAPPHGHKPLLGTNPIAMAVPDQQHNLAFQFDQSTSAIALGVIHMAAKQEKKIPFGLAIDQQGNPTDDPHQALKGSLLSAGGYKGFGFGLLAEVFAACLTGSINSIHTSALKAPEGVPHNLGQYYLLQDPRCFCGDVFWQRLATLQQAVDAQPGTRLPGSKRNIKHTVNIDRQLWQRTLELAENKNPS